ncbi:hypothetical protein HOK68_03505 [Candidatus Woesearchaeota archaeon]|jgi:hypothetical protein|nr:hypothetical protein [Candidatus Woesearchaeota archaeon]MBT4387567.1 hypothetical protein [Candidatus Woesearchaeota archaeon]MBT4595409.1 hypothetical protein [Candidatus Woesearchaeota archaeon]MBT5741186.1 hypothetical protein [Candidatus Woesearchaeota archaeon]MBT6505820.1 hypothetical protein [Candidatus Woesearchaeota archaeon]
MKLNIIGQEDNKIVNSNNLKNHIYKRVKKTIKDKTKLLYLKTDFKIDDYATDLIKKIIINNKKSELKIIGKNELNKTKEKIIYPLSAFYKDIILLSHFILNKKIEFDNIIFLFENVSNKELELQNVNIDELDKIFMNNFKIKKSDFEILKTFLEKLENKYPGIELATKKSQDIINEMI